MLTIDPRRLDLCEEYFRNPAGPHSLELQRLLHVMRADTVADPFALVEIGPACWSLAKIDRRRGSPIRLLAGFHYADWQDGQRTLFALRWKRLTGEAIPFGPSLPDAASVEETYVPAHVLAYAEPWTVRPGDSVDIKIDPIDDGPVEVRILRVRCAVDRPPHYRLKLLPVDPAVSRSLLVTRKETVVGSFIAVDGIDRLPDTVTLEAFVCPAAMAEPVMQSLVGDWDAGNGSGRRLLLDETGAGAMQIGDGSMSVTCSTAIPLEADRWYRLVGSFDAATGRLAISQTRLDGSGGVQTASHALTTGIRPRRGSRFLIAAANRGRSVADGFNGKMAAPALYASGGADGGTDVRPPLAQWDFSLGIDSDQVVDTAADQHHGRCVNTPTRGVTGRLWDGTEHCWRHRPAHYDAIRFHADAQTDCDWPSDLSLAVPETWPSGIYMAEVRQGDQCGYATFFLSPPTGRPTAKLAVLLPTVSYCCYGNDSSNIANARAIEKTTNLFLSLSRIQTVIHSRPCLGTSAYNRHADGRGVAIVSRRRPVLELAPGSAIWNFGADTLLIDWLCEKRIAHDVITDDALHDEGLELVAPYTCIMLASHPEYYSTPMIAALDRYIAAGGRIISLGGNSLYWKVGMPAGDSHRIEVRRAEAGARGWAAEPGEYHLQSTGELSGLWRRNGRPPQGILGVGTTAFGFDAATCYRRTAASFDDRAAFIFAGIGAEEIIGDFSHHRTGAAGIEVDRADPALGTPAHALVVATANTFPASYTIAPEDILYAYPMANGETAPTARADMVFFETPAGGAVFSTGSIAWCDALNYDDYDNNVSRITRNVVDRFLSNRSFCLPE